MDWIEVEVAALRLAAQAEMADAVDRCLGVLRARPTTPEAEKRYGMHAGLVVAIVAEASVRGVERVVSLLNEQAGTSLALGPWVAASDAEGGSGPTISVGRTTHGRPRASWTAPA